MLYNDIYNNRINYILYIKARERNKLLIKIRLRDILIRYYSNII